jgi:hypothetical protein
MMLDLNAPIVPGVSVAGFHIGQFIEPNWSMGAIFVRESIHNPYIRSSDGINYRYRSESVDLWVTNSLIQQIGVHGVYRGKLLGQIMLGMTIEDIERRIGPCMEDNEDNLVIAGIKGLRFDVAWRPNHPAKELDLRSPEQRFEPITWFFICQSQAIVQYPLHTLRQAT